MLRKKNISEKLESEFERVENEVTEDYANGYVQSEERISGALTHSLGNIKELFKPGKDYIEIDLDVYEAIDEPKSGADMGIRYQFQTPDHSVSRGIIAQAKRYDETHDDLNLQCWKMTARTEESYVFVYSESMISVFPALPILLDGGYGGKFTKYYYDCFPRFMCDYIRGFHGEIPIANKLDKPSEVSPIEERVRFLVDFKVSVGIEGDFDGFDLENYRKTSSNREF